MEANSKMKMNGGWKTDQNFSAQRWKITNGIETNGKNPARELHARKKKKYDNKKEEERNCK